MAAVAHSHLAGNSLAPHCPVEVEVAVEKEVIIAAVDKPFHATERSIAGIIGLFYEFDAVVIDNRFLNFPISP